MFKKILQEIMPLLLYLFLGLFIACVVKATVDFNKASERESFFGLPTKQKGTFLNPQSSYEDKFVVKELYHYFGNSHAMVLLPNNILLVSEKKGILHKYNLESEKREKITIPMEGMVSGQQTGMLDVAIAPDYLDDPWVYISHTIKNDEDLYSLRLIRVKIKDRTVLASEILFTADAYTDSVSQFGGAIEFDDKGYMYLSIGDRSQRDIAQNLNTHAGKILRLYPDGKVPQDNPFIRVPDALPEIYSYGHRNPQGLYYDRETSTLYETEHGPRGGDEVNVIHPGKNYGWPIISYGFEYRMDKRVGVATSKAGMEQPEYYYLPSIATSSIFRYRGKMFPEWRGDIFVGSLRFYIVSHLSVNDAKIKKERRYLGRAQWRIRDILEGPAGEILVLTEDGLLISIFRNRMAYFFKLLSEIYQYIGIKIKNFLGIPIPKNNIYETAGYQSYMENQ